MRTVTTVGDLVRVGAATSPARTAVKERGGRSCDYAELDRRSTRLASALLGAGLRPGDRVATWLEDLIEYVEAYLAAAKAGVVVVPVNARFVAREARHLLTDSGARALLSSPGVAGQAAELDDLPDLLRVGVGEGAHGRCGYEELVASGSDELPAAPGEDDVLVLGYTSGTTGRPKGAMLTHRSVLAIARLNAISYRLPVAGVAAFTGSMSFVATVPAHVLSHLLVGGSVVLMGRWTPDELVDTLRDEGATFTYVPSPLLDAVTDRLAARPDDWPALQTVLHGASRAEPSKLRALAGVIGHRFVEGWGMTENSGGLMTATSPADVLDGRAFTTVGRAAAETTLEVLGSDGSAVPHDGQSVGELVFRSPALFTGYWGNPDASAAALRDGWFHSGDLGTIDPDGYVTILERRTDLIVSGGMNVYPSEVEDQLGSHPDVEACAVVGVPHERWGQAVVAAVVLADGADADDVALVAHCTAGLASYKKPTRIVFVDELPRTASLKVKRNEVRELVMRPSAAV